MPPRTVLPACRINQARYRCEMSEQTTSSAIPNLPTTASSGDVGVAALFAVLTIARATDVQSKYCTSSEIRLVLERP
jgi:hypothetical protein